MTAPRVSVILPVHNAQRYLAAALDSVLAQTFSDFEIIAIDDGSSDSSGAMLDTYAAADSRVHVFHQANLGLSTTLNRALELAVGEYAARMDADDISLPNRLAQQVSFLDRHLEIGVLGSWVEAFDEMAAFPWHYPTSDVELRCLALFSSPFVHPAVMYRRSLVQKAGGYSTSYPVAADYDLWLRLATFTQLASLPRILLQRRLHPTQMVANVEQVAKEIGVLHRTQLDRLGLQPTTEEYAIHWELGLGRVTASPDALRQLDAWLQKLAAANLTNRVWPEPAFGKYLGERWRLACYQGHAQGWWVWQQYWQSPLHSAAPMSRKRELRFALVCAWHQLRLRH